MEQNRFKKYKKGNKNRATVKKDHWNEEKKKTKNNKQLTIQNAQPSHKRELHISSHI